MLSVSFVCVLSLFFFKQKTAYEMRISDWSSDVCSSDLPSALQPLEHRQILGAFVEEHALGDLQLELRGLDSRRRHRAQDRRGQFQIGRASCRERVCQYV